MMYRCLSTHDGDIKNFTAVMSGNRCSIAVRRINETLIEGSCDICGSQPPHTLHCLDDVLLVWEGIDIPYHSCIQLAHVNHWSSFRPAIYHKHLQIPGTRFVQRCHTPILPIEVELLVECRAFACVETIETCWFKIYLKFSWYLDP